MQQLQQQVQQLQAMNYDNLPPNLGHEDLDDEEDIDPFHDGHSNASIEEVHIRRVRQASNGQCDLGIKVEIPEFERRLQPEELLIELML